MSTKKKLQELDFETAHAFGNVKQDIVFLLKLAEAERRRVTVLEDSVKRIVREITKSHRHGVTGTYPTLAGKVKAIAENLGIEFGVEPRKVSPTKVVAVKKAVAKKAKK